MAIPQQIEEPGKIQCLSKTEKALGEIDANLKEIEVSIDSLGTRLASVLLPDSAVVTDEEKITEPPASPLVTHLRWINNKLKEFNRSLRELDHLVEL